MEKYVHCIACECRTYEDKNFEALHPDVAESLAAHVLFNKYLSKEAQLLNRKFEDQMNGQFEDVKDEIIGMEKSLSAI